MEIRNVCKKCQHRKVCRKIFVQMSELERIVEINADISVVYHSVKMTLDEQGFRYPQTYYGCTYSFQDDEDLIVILDKQKWLFDMVRLIAKGF